MKGKKSVVYVNYSPYENSGRILDYLLENFSYVFLISLSFYYLGSKQKSNSLTVYKDGKILQKFSFPQIPMSRQLLFLLLPIKSVINLVQILFWGHKVYKLYSTIDYYFSVNAYTSWVGNILRAFGLVRKTIFWVWDYYPPMHESLIISAMRSIYWQFDKLATHSDRVAFVNKRLIDLRKDMGLLPPEVGYPVVPIGTDVVPYVIKKHFHFPIFVFLGMIKKSQGVGIVLDHAKEIIKKYPGARYEVIGSGPDEKYFHTRASHSSIKTHFYGYMAGNSFQKILQKCTIGIAAYVPDPSNVSHFGDAGKIKLYISYGLPVIATDVFEFSQEIKNTNAGVIIHDSHDESFVAAVDEIMNHYNYYRQHAKRLAGKYYYKKVYRVLFEKL